MRLALGGNPTFLEDSDPLGWPAHSLSQFKGNVMTNPEFRMKSSALLFRAAMLVAVASSLHAQIAVSANDGKQLRPGDDPPGMRPDTVATIDLNQYPPKVLATIPAPACMIGPPDAVAVAPDSSFAIVTACQKPDPGDATKLVLADTVSVVDLSDPKKPKVIQTTAAGPGASGVSFNPAVSLVLVANTSGSISVFSLAKKKLAKVEDVQMEDGSAPTDVVFNRDGKKAYVVERGGNRLAILNVDGTKVTASGQSVVTGASPYGMAITPDGRYAINTNLQGAIDPNAPARRPMGGAGPAAGAAPAAAPGGSDGQAPVRRQPRSGTITLVDLQTNQVVDSAQVGPTPEHVVLSPNGKYAEVTVANGAASSVTDANYNTTHGLMLVYGVEGGKLVKLASTDTGHWCQGATWNKDSNEILLQCATERQIEVYKFDGKSLSMDSAATLKFDARPGAIATATNQ
jgi:DNA-binding beta-propeller fold protein YncE